jgi:hypothetical protein
LVNISAVEFGKWRRKMFEETDHITIGLTLEDDFTLTRLKNVAHDLRGEARDQYLWKTIFRFVCRERAYKCVMKEMGLNIDTNVDIFDSDDE